MLGFEQLLYLLDTFQFKVSVVIPALVDESLLIAFPFEFFNVVCDKVDL